MSRDDDLARVVRFVQSMQDRMAERRVRFSYGTALLHGGLPHVWDVNFVRVDAVDRQLAVDDCVEQVDRILASAGLAHRKMNVDDGVLGQRMAPELRAAGWRATENLVMARRATVSAPRAAAVLEVDADALRPKWEQGIRSAPWATDNEQAVTQLLEAQALRESAVQVRYFAAQVDGKLVSECSLFTRGGVAQIESVHTLEEHRGHGLAGAVISRAMDEATAAGHRLVFLLTDADGRSKKLYRRLGFTEIGRIWDFVKPP